METVQQNGRFTLFSSKFPSNIYSILFVHFNNRLAFTYAEILQSILDRTLDFVFSRFRGFSFT